jgi:hypothetical protein
LTLKVKPSALPRTAELEISLPEWLPVATVMLRTFDSCGILSENVFLRGKTSSISIPLSSAGGWHDMKFSPSFVPAFTGLGDDQRELCAMMLKCQLSSAGGESVLLYPENPGL